MKMIWHPSMFFRRLLFEHYLDKNEQLYHTIHRHWVTVHGQMIRIALFGYAVPLFIIFFITGTGSPLALALYVWLLITLLYTLYAFLDWYLDAWLVTDVSLINTRWDGFFKRSSSRVDYESIESVDIERKGIKQSILNYGKICLIRSSNIHVIMDHVHSPEMASSWISRARNQATASKSNQDAEAIKGLLADIIEERIKVKS